MLELIDAKAHGWDPKGLQTVSDFAQSAGSAQLMIKHSAGLLIDAKFEAQPVDVFAVQKGLVAILVGMAQEKGFLEVYDHINHHLQPEWTQLSPWDEAKLNVETLLTMTTGMDDALGLLGEINKTWRYNNVAYGYLKQLLEQSTGKTLSVLTDEWLMQPLGMSQTRWRARDQVLPDGTPMTGLVSTAADLVMLGDMILNRGRVAGETIFGDAYYLDDLIKPGSAMNPAWGWFWWNNNQSHFMLPGSDKTYAGVPLPDAPQDLFSARGAFGNFLTIVPSLNIVVARTTSPSSANNSQKNFEGEFWRHLMAARS